MNGQYGLRWSVHIIENTCGVFSIFFTHSHLHATTPSAFAAVTDPSRRDTRTQPPSASPDGQIREDDVYLFSVTCDCVVIYLHSVCLHLVSVDFYIAPSLIHFVILYIIFKKKHVYLELVHYLLLTVLAKGFLDDTGGDPFAQDAPSLRCFNSRRTRFQSTLLLADDVHSAPVEPFANKNHVVLGFWRVHVDFASLHILAVIDQRRGKRLCGLVGHAHCVELRLGVEVQHVRHRVDTRFLFVQQALFEYLQQRFVLWARLGNVGPTRTQHPQHPFRPIEGAPMQRRVLVLAERGVAHDLP